MPPTFTYPGVYIEEIPSGVHTITGVATSIAAFIGWAPAGPTVKATLVQSFSDLSMLPNDAQSRYVGSVINDPRTGSQTIQLTGISVVPAVQPAPNALTTPGMPPAPYMLAGGDDGTVLNPGSPAFHTALNA